MGMMRILKCEKCGNYSMNENCRCGGKNVIVKPPKYSPDDKYAGLRRQVKRGQLEEKGLL
jgi:H/ACA ribonucleoprotein complex subunit 3